MRDRFIINIPRPYPGTDQNARQIAFIEPLRQQNRIQVSDAYRYNLRQFNAGEECSLSPGYRYEFAFFHKEDAAAFKLAFGEEEVI